jgi:phenylalanine-4-hydroxylase
MHTLEEVIPLDSGHQLCALPENLDVHAAPIPQYTDIEHDTWSRLMHHQLELWPTRAAPEFLDGIHNIAFPEDHIPKLSEISDRLQTYCGWRLTRVDGIVADEDFFFLLSQKIFPSTDFIRKPEDFGYTPAPDMFHDLIGHTPLLTHKRFARFFELFGQAGLSAFRSDHPLKHCLAKFYWFTVEFGLIRHHEGLRIYGAGILSSVNEVGYSLSDKTKKHLFDPEVIAHRSYDFWHMQDDLFVIENFDQLEQGFYHWAKTHQLLN